MSEQFLNEYTEFVDGVTSDASKNRQAFLDRIGQLYDEGCNVERLLTSACGMSAEGGEFMEIVKKMIFQGKPFSEDNLYHMKRELGDVAWYWANACLALNMDPYEVLVENVHKLESRFPGGKFDISKSENRKSGDL
jgi:NTP pyrophosphatase (non-canonical NTP hydrolase)